MGVASGPFGASLLRRIDSSVSAGIGVPWVGTAPAPAAARCHSSRAPAASMTSTAALTTSGPIPSPGMSVTGMAMAGAFLTFRRGGGNPQRDEKQEDLHSQEPGGDRMQAAELRQLCLSG